MTQPFLKILNRTFWGILCKNMLFLKMLKTMSEQKKENSFVEEMLNVELCKFHHIFRLIQNDIYTGLSIYLFINLSIYLPILCISLSMYLSFYTYMYLYIYTHRYLYLYSYYIYLSIYLSMSILSFLSILPTYLSIYLNTYLSLSYISK